jgi:hypothetical protein
MPMRTHPSARLKLWINLELISMFNSDLFTCPFLPFLNITSTVMAIFLPCRVQKLVFSPVSALGKKLLSGFLRLSGLAGFLC